MAPTKPTKASNKTRTKSKPGSNAKKPKSSSSAPTGISKRKQKFLALAKPGGAQKTKSKLHDNFNVKKKKRKYLESELDIPTLNSIIPAGIAKPKGQKKGKKFVDDVESMSAIMAMVNAEKEGHIEGKLVRARQLEEVREAKRKEAEKREGERKQKFEGVKEGLRKKRGKKGRAVVEDNDVGKENIGVKKSGKKEKKRVSFG